MASPWGGEALNRWRSPHRAWSFPILRGRCFAASTALFAKPMRISKPSPSLNPRSSPGYAGGEQKKGPSALGPPRERLSKESWPLFSAARRRTSTCPGAFYPHRRRLSLRASRRAGRWRSTRPIPGALPKALARGFRGSSQVFGRASRKKLLQKIRRWKPLPTGKK